MELMRDFLTTNCACTEGVEWFDAQSESDVVKVLRKLDKEGHTDWANWLIVRKMTKKQCILFAIFAAEQVIDIYEKKYPDDNHPRQAIDAAKKYLEHPSKENAHAAEAAADAAADAADEAVDAGYAYAAEAADAHAAEAANAAAAAGYTHTTKAADYPFAPDAAAHAAHAADAAHAAAYGKEKTQQKILNYGIKLIN